ncbi:MAG TPA: signal peptide peptidase SppA [Terriglobia bacterium]|nr:signal peptide peptidase SppA [Terriglobia bacterium]
MKKVGKIILILVVLVLVLQIAGIALLYFARRIKPDTVLTMRIEGSVSEQAPQDVLTDLLAGGTTTVTDIVEALDRAQNDPRITGVFLRVSESTMSMGKLQEVRNKIQEFNRSGKFSVAYLEFGTNRSYYLASTCKTVILLPKSLLYIRGMMASSTFFRGFLDKLGIYPDLLHIGEYKNASNIFTEKKYTPAHREATETLLGDWFQEYLAGIAESRGLDPEEVKKLVEKGPLSSEEARAARLVDRVAYQDEAEEFVKQKNHGSDHRIRLRDYLDRTERDGHEKLAVIYATGMIMPGRSGGSPGGETTLGSETMSEQFRRVRDDKAIKAVILRIDSPGGSAYSSEVIRREVEITRRKKPVVVSMSDVAASGGYWIAMSADKIIAQPGTVTGSIGVITGKFNIKGLFEKLGMTKDLVTTTENSTLDWPFQNYSPAQRESVQKNMRDIYNDFLSGVAAGRHMKVEDVDKIAQGRVWTGERALKLGLVDEMGGLDAAIAAAKQLAKIPKQEEVSLLFLPPTKSILEKIRDLMDYTGVLSDAASPRTWLRQLEALSRERVWAILPSVPEVE